MSLPRAMLDDFLHRFKILADALMSHPRVRVTHLWIGPPATPEALARLAAAWGHELPAQLVVLYRQADGMQLRWVDIGDDADDYERLRADPAALTALLRGPATPIFAALASVSQMTHRMGLPDGPAICSHAWAHAALSARLPPAVAVADLIRAAQTLLEHPEVRTQRSIAWPKTRPPLAGRLDRPGHQGALAPPGRRARPRRPPPPRTLGGPKARSRCRRPRPCPSRSSPSRPWCRRT